MCECERTQAVSGSVALQNGLVLDWLRFVDAALSIEAARDEAIAIVTGQHKGTVARCWCN
jgi:hypothetical protein